MNKQTLPHRLRILGNPCSKSIDLQIPMQQGQTCIEAILLTLQTVGCHLEKPIKIASKFRCSRRTILQRGGPSHLGPTWSEHTGFLPLQHHSTLKLNDRLTMFLPEETNTITWRSACLAEDTEIRLADGTFALIQNSIRKEIWTDQPNIRKTTG